MKAIFFIFILFLSLTSCKKDVYKIDESWKKITERLQYHEQSDYLHLKSGNFNYKLSVSKLPLKKVILLNASLVGFFSELNIEDRIVGVSSPEFIFSDKILNQVKSEKIANVGNEQKYDIEKIIVLKPDAIFTNHIASFENTYELLKKNDIEIIFLDEYLEQKPLDKSKYLLLFGRLFGQEKLAQEKFENIKKSYDSLSFIAKKSTEKPKVLANEMYGNQWFVPGGNTYLSHFINDAYAEYIFKDNQDDKAIPMSFEEVYAKAKDTKIWINAGNHKRKKELLEINPNYSKMNVFNNGSVFVITGREKKRANDYFQSGVVRSDLVLKDYIKIFHPNLLPNHTLYYMKELK